MLFEKSKFLLDTWHNLSPGPLSPKVLGGPYTYTYLLLTRGNELYLHQKKPNLYLSKDGNDAVLFRRDRRLEAHGTQGWGLFWIQMVDVDQGGGGVEEASPLPGQKGSVLARF